MRDIAELTKKLRRKYPFFSCPTKADRIFLTEEEWVAIDWTLDEISRNIALPHKMWNMRHDDHLWPSCKKFRGEDAYGPRAPRDHPKFLPVPPRLIKGYNIQRWVKPNDESIIRIERFKDKWITEKDLPERIEAVEMKKDRSDAGEKKVIRLSEYAPDDLQKYSTSHYLFRKPDHTSWHKILWDRGDFPYEDGGSIKWFYRSGWSYDSFDNYYIKNGFAFGPNWT